MSARTETSDLWLQDGAQPTRRPSCAAMDSSGRRLAMLQPLNGRHPSLCPVLACWLACSRTATCQYGDRSMVETECSGTIRVVSTTIIFNMLPKGSEAVGIKSVVHFNSEYCKHWKPYEASQQARHQQLQLEI